MSSDSGEIVSVVADGKLIPAPTAGLAIAKAPAKEGGSAAAKQENAVGAAAPISATVNLKPIESRLVQAHSFNGDLRDLAQTPPRKRDRPEREDPEVTPRVFERPAGISKEPPSGSGLAPAPLAPAPSPISNFLGLDFANWGAGRPPDTVGDVGPLHYIQAVNTSIGIYRKSDSAQLAAFTFDTFMSQGNFGNLCDTDNFGDPVILYDTFEDRWVITDFAFQLDGSNNVINPPGAFQCFAVSKTGDPVVGGWNFYSINLTDSLNDYPKFGIWPDGIYMSANMFAFPAGGGFQGTRVWAFNKAQMYANTPTVQVVSFKPPTAEFTLIPANARLQAGTPPAGTPNYFSVVWQFTNAVSIYKFHVDWDRISLSTFTGPDIVIAPASWIDAPSTVPAQGGNNNDTLGRRLMMQSQYANIGGVESLWNSHTIRNPTTAGVSAVRYYQTTVTGGTVAAATVQAATHAPDTTNRYMPSLAVDRAGNMMLGYSASSAALFPAIRYAGRLSTDPVNTLPQTETSLVAGTGSQNTSNRWGDYSAMSLAPDGCTFWFTNEYYIATGNNWQTRVGSFTYPSCTPVGAGGTVSGTVIATTGGAPISGATIAFGSRTTTTNGSGFYQFLSIPAGTYPSISASFPGKNSSTSMPVIVADATTTTKNFTLDTAPIAACLTDTSQSDFQTGVPTTVDQNGSPGNVTLLNAANVDQQNLSVTSSGFGFTSTAWFGQTFQPAVTGQLTRADIDLFCSGCTGTIPNITVSIRNTSGDLPTGADLATATIPGFSSGAGGFFPANFTTPPTLTAGTRYSLVLRAVSNPSAGTYAYVVSTGSPYANGRRVTSANSGGTWTGQTTDVGFVTFMNTGFAASGTQVSSLKDANPAATFTPNWTTLSWNATVPANTTLQFQVAASNSASGPFNFVGPDSTAGTFFTISGASLSQFNGNRYLKYKAYLSTTDNTVTPTVNDVTVCFTDTAPTDVTLNWFAAEGHAATANSPNGGVLLRWQTGYEVANLGFHIYREDAGKRVRVTPDFVAGSALLVGARTVLGAGRSYVWRDSQGGNADSVYWLESIDLNGFSVWYGPVRATTGQVKKPSSAQVELESKLIGELTGGADGATLPLELRATQVPMTITGLASQATIARQSAVKISVQREGWYRVSQSELVAAGLDLRGDPRLLQLLVDGQEQPINVVTEKDGRLSAIEFYGIGVDSPYTNLRTYWLTASDQPGKRIDQSDAAGSDATGGSFPYAVERRERTIYFSSLRNGDKENFFGSVIARDPVDQSLSLSHVETQSSDGATLEVALQGVSTAAHNVTVELNGSYAGMISFNGQSEGVGLFNVQPSLLREGPNALRLTSGGGPSDISLVGYIRLTYPHRYTAEGNALRFTVAGKQMVTVDGFSSPAIRVLDITNPAAVQEMIGKVQQQKSGGYAVSLNLQSAESRTLLAIAGDMSKPVSLAPNNPSSWRQPVNGASLVILSPREFFASLSSLVSLRQKQGYSVAVVDIEDVYDEFSYGQKTPQAVKDFLAYAAANWKKAPRFVMLAGDASFDPKNYLGFGDSDLVPTKLIDTQYLETASDDWLVDFNRDGLPDMAIGRLPVRSAAEALRLATKIAGYDEQRSAGTLLLVSDHNDTFDFESASNMLRGLIPRNIRIETVERANLDDASAKARLIDAINRGQIIVNYAGHGSANQWRGNILTSADAAGLTNAGELSMFVMMTCLNGYFQDAALDSLAESLLKATGGAVAVWGSSGMTTPDIQSVLNQQAYRMIFNGTPTTIGEATARAKAAVTNGDVRRTWILLGDPSMKLK
ncbi:MAG: C25 family cysteine peptidase [Acidobacteriota bacterium]